MTRVHEVFVKAPLSQDARHVRRVRMLTDHEQHRSEKT